LRILVFLASKVLIEQHRMVGRGTSIRDPTSGRSDTNGVASIEAAVRRASSPRSWSPEETKLYLKEVRLPEDRLSDYADRECPPKG